MSLNTVLSLNLNASLVGTNAAGGTPSFSLNLQPLVSGTLVTGTGSGKADQLYTAQVILAASATTDLNLNSLGNDNLGNALAPVNVKLLAILMQGNLGCTYLSSVALHSGGGGTGYTLNDTLTVAGGTGTAATVKASGVTGGVITAVTVLTPGSYTANPTTSANSATGGTGTGASLDLTMGTIAQGAQVYTESDYITVGGDGTSNAWVSVLPVNTYTLRVYSGNSTLPGFLVLGNASNAGYAIGSTNRLLKFANSGSNPVTFNLYIIGATA